MNHFYANQKHSAPHNKKSSVNILLAAVLLAFSFNVKAQNVLVGLTSNGGINGKGTAFQINTNGNNFSIINGFTDWGNTPHGSLFKDTDGNFYGMTSSGGTNNYGTIFKMTPAGEITILRQLVYATDGGYPYGELIKGADGYLYGLTAAGGTNTYGTIFKISTSGDFTVIRHLAYADGANPHGHLTLASDGNFYGITYSGGSTGAGAIFKLTPGGAFSVIHSMVKATEGANSYASLTEGGDGNLYGTCYGGGQYGFGTIFKVTKAGVLTVLRHLYSTTDGTYPQSDLLKAKDGFLYGTCYGGGPYGGGTIFKVSNKGAYTVLKNLSVGADGGYPYGGIMQYNDTSFYGITRSGGPKSGGTIYRLTTTGKYTIIHALDYNNEGSSSSSVPAKGNDGNLYAMASAGGLLNYGIIFKTTTAGDFTILNTFNGSVQGNSPYGSFIKGKDSAYYCMANAGGAYGHGSIVKICGGTATVFHSFNKATEGGFPKGSLLLASDGNFYGMTSTGGTKAYGTIFKITSAGVFTVIHDFITSTEGGSPAGSLIQARDGFLYGMTTGGGAGNAGTIFKLKTSGSNFTVVKSFVFATDGGSPQGSLLQANDSNFYGMTSNSGRIFKLTPTGVYTNLHTFNSSYEGYNPMGSLIQGKDGYLYGTCSDGSASAAGTIFKAGLDGSIKMVVALNNTTQGRMPKGALMQGPDGMLYGTTSIGGTYNAGTIFKLTTSGTLTVLRHLNMVTDGGNAYSTLIFAPINNLVADAKTASVNEDSNVQITLSGSGGSTLKYTIINKPIHGKLTGTAPAMTYTPNKNYSGKDSFSYLVKIGCIASAKAFVSITVKPMPDTPVLTAIGNKTVKKDSTLKFTAKATDADAGQKITYSLIGAPAGATINATSGAFTWKATTVGTFTFKVRATDNGTPALYDEEQIKVTVANTLAAMAAENFEVTETASVNIFPNPAHDILHISIPAGTDNVLARIIDANGKIISTYNLKNNGKANAEVNVSSLINGIYFLQVQAGELKETLKFIKN